MANPDLKYTDRLQMLLIVGILGSSAGALLAGYQLALEPGKMSTPLLMGGTVLAVIFSYVALIGAVGIGVKFGDLAAAGQARVDDSTSRAG